MVPVLAIGFDDLNGRIQVQNKRIALYKERCHELDARLDVLLRKQQTDTETSLIIIRQKYRALFKVILQLMIALERLRKGPSSSLSDRVEADLRGQILELARKVSGDQSLSLRLNQLSEMLLQTQPLFEDNSHLLGNTQRPPSVFCLEDSALSEQAVKAKMSFLELLEEYVSAFKEFP